MQLHMNIPPATAVRPPKKGRLHRWRRAVQVVTSILLLIAPFIGLLRFDIAGGRLVIGGRGFYSGELFPIYLLLLALLVMLFGGALVHGRLWCGWLCPQTTLSELADSFDRKLLKKRNPGALRRFAAKALAGLVAALVAASSVSYFTSDVIHPSRLGIVAWVSFAVMFVLLAANLWWVRHRFCGSVCPYGILLGVVADHHTLGVAYDDKRGATDCTDCGACHRACFVGIDIRKRSMDLACLACGDCIDACDDVLGRKKLRGLIEYRFGTAPTRWPRWLTRIGVSDGRRAAILGVSLALLAAFAVSLVERTPIDLHVAAAYDRAAVREGMVRNSYRLTLTNRLDAAIDVRVEAAGIEGLKVVTPAQPTQVAAHGRTMIDVELALPSAGEAMGARPAVIRVVYEGGKSGDRRDARNAGAVEKATRFFVPARGR